MSVCIADNASVVDDDLMWVRLAGWMIADAELPLPAVGDVLEQVGVRVSGAVAYSPSAPVGIDESATTDPGAGHRQPFPTYAVTGVAHDPRDLGEGVNYVGPPHNVAECVLDVNDLRLCASFDGPAARVQNGAAVTVHGSLAIIAEYEYDLSWPDIRSAWMVLDVQGDRAEDWPDDAVWLNMEPHRTLGETT